MLLDLEKWKRLSNILDREELDGLIVNLTENVLYFTNWWSFSGCDVAVVLRDKDPILLVPNLDVDLLENTYVSDVRCYNIENIDGLFQELNLIGLNGLKIGIEESFQRLACAYFPCEVQVPGTLFFEKLRQHFPYTTFIDATSIICEMRQEKSGTEIEQLKIVQKLNEYGIVAAYEACENGITEIEIQTSLEKATNDAIIIDDFSNMLVRCYAFVNAGKNGARVISPYKFSSAYHVKKGEFCTIGVSTQANGYWSEIMRTFVVGHQPTEEQEDMFEIINSVNVKTCQIMIPCCDTLAISDTTNAMVKQTQYAIYHTPSFIHEIGLKLQDYPIWPTSTSLKLILKLGNYFAIESGFYVREMGALRIKRNVFIQEGGGEIIDSALNQL